MSDARPDPPEATVRADRRERFSLIWLIPIVAAALALYLGYQTLAARGPLITITLPDAGGLTAGQTKVEQKAVALGTVESVRLSKNLQSVAVSVRMTKEAVPFLTDRARFWVERPRVSLSGISGIETLVSGSYIAMDPGEPGGQPQRNFQGLSTPPGVRSDEPGRSFTLSAARVGSLGTGSPVFYRDISVGQVLDYVEPGTGAPAMIHFFVKAPYDHFVRTDTRFWNVAGLSVNIGPQGVHVEVASLQAVLSGGVAFANLQANDASPPAKEGNVFELYQNFDDAQNAGFHNNIRYVTYPRESVAGLGPGSAVQLYGFRVGTVTAVKLQLGANANQPRVRVTFEVQPERVFSNSEVPRANPLQATRALVKLGMRARIDTKNYLTGQDVLGLDFVPDAPAAEVGIEGDLIVMPSQGGGLQDITSSLGGIVSKLNSIPFDKIGANANHLLESAGGTLGSADLKTALRNLSSTLESLHNVAATTESGLRPLMSRLPALSRQLQETVERTDRLLSSVQSGYGNNSDLHQSAEQLITQATQAVRSIDQLSSYVTQHPASVLWGRR
ncbi:MAG: MlaD family protein [Pseudomonadota bacterium]|nr:MlaD family protein [Pseudomonadota bacterium]